MDLETNQLTQEEKNILLHVARQAITTAVKGFSLPSLEINNHSAALKNEGASFVTLTKNDSLRGCIGTMEAHQPLIADVQEHAVAAALSDFRFNPVKSDELDLIKIEVSRLTPLDPLPHQSAQELLGALRIGVDGVLIHAGNRRATFLPQVWEQLPDPSQFLSQLCLKMGASADYWKSNTLEVFTYQVEKFSE